MKTMLALLTALTMSNCMSFMAMENPRKAEMEGVYVTKTTVILGLWTNEKLFYCDTVSCREVSGLSGVKEYQHRSQVDAF